MDGGQSFGSAISFAPRSADHSFGDPSPATEESLHELLTEHRDLVLSIAARHALPGIDPARLVSAGIEGLVDAASRFDASCGPFEDFAAWWIRRAVSRRAAATY